MDVRRFNEDEALLISETTEGAYEAVRQHVTVFFAYYITNHVDPDDDATVVALTTFFSELQDVLKDMKVPEASYIIEKANEYMDEQEKKKGAE